MFAIINILCLYLFIITNIMENRTITLTPKLEKVLAEVQAQGVKVERIGGAPVVA